MPADLSDVVLDVSKFILNCMPSPSPEKDWDINAAIAANLHVPGDFVPPSKDLREDWWSIGDQSVTGSCVGWGTGDGVLRWHFVKAGKLGTDESLSVRYLWMAAKETDSYTTHATSFIEQDGTWPKAALDIARKYGVVTDSILPFETPAGSLVLYAGGSESTFYALASQRRIAGYFNLGTSLAIWRAWIAYNGPIVTRLIVDPAWDNATATLGNLDTYDAANARGGHCVALVGYTPDRFIVRNSWGTSWGDQGFAYASNAYASAAFVEAYGVVL